MWSHFVKKTMVCLFVYVYKHVRVCIEYGKMQRLLRVNTAGSDIGGMTIATGKGTFIFYTLLVILFEL